MLTLSLIIASFVRSVEAVQTDVAANQVQMYRGSDCEVQFINFVDVLTDEQVDSLNADGTVSTVDTGLTHLGTAVTMDIVGGPATGSSNMSSSPGVMNTSGSAMRFTVPGASVGGMKLDFSFSVARPLRADNTAAVAGPLGFNNGAAEQVNLTAGATLVMTTTGNMSVTGANSTSVMLVGGTSPGKWEASTGANDVSTFSYEYYVDRTRGVAFREDLQVGLEVCSVPLAVEQLSTQQAESTIPMTFVLVLVATLVGLTVRQGLSTSCGLD